MNTTMQIEDVAEICHEALRAYSHNSEVPPWAIAAPWVKQGATSGVRFHLSQPETTAREAHGVWLKEKRAGGWKLGPELKPERKEHPFVISWDGLSPEQQLRETLFKAIVEACRPYLRNPNDE